MTKNRVKEILEQIESLREELCSHAEIAEQDILVAADVLTSWDLERLRGKKLPDDLLEDLLCLQVAVLRQRAASQESQA